MAKSKNDLNIQFKGKMGDLVIKVNGEIIYPYQEEKVKKEINPNKLKTQLKAGVAAVFSGGVNRIKPLYDTWKRWPVKSRIPYRNILAANIKLCTAEHPTTASMICPDSGLYLPPAQSLISAKEIKIEVQTFNKDVELTEKENTFTVAGILSVYSPRKKEYESFTICPLSMVVKDFMSSQNIGVTFSITDDMAAIISKYEKCILYYTVTTSHNGEMTRRWFKANYQEYLLSNDAEGKFTGGKRINQDN